jgi:hypothetical protein
MMRARVVVAALMCWASVPAHASVPDAHAVQRAYERAKSDEDSNPKHVYELAIQAAKCSPLESDSNYMCQIDFVRKDQPTGRLYFEVVTLAARQGDWVLLSGLCKTKPAKAAR